MKACLFCAVAALPVLVFSASSVVNGDFEQFDAKGKPLGWSLPPQFCVERAAGSNGSTGLVFENADPSYRQAAVLQRIDVKPGDVFELGGWVNVERLEKGGGGCMFVCMWQDANGHDVGETQTDSLREPTKGWVKLHGITRALPTNAVYGTFGFFSRSGNVGRISVDKVYCRPYLRQPVAGVYTSAYRDEVTEGPVCLAAALTPAAFGTETKDVRAVFTVRRPDGSCLDIEGNTPSTDEARAELDAGQLGLGTNVVSCTLRSGTRTIGTASTTLVRTVRPRPRKTYIDRYGRAIVDGQPFFPIGAFMNGIDEHSIAKYVDSAFNCVMPYGPQPKTVIDQYSKAGLKVIYYLANHWEDRDAGTNHVRKIISEFKDHPAVIAWYIYDEKPTSMIPVLTGRHQLIVSLDDQHPTWVSQDLPAETRHYLGSFDVFGGDPYPIPYRDIASAGEWVNDERRGLMGVRPIWQVPQFMSWRWYRPQDETLRCPTAAEFRNMAWQAVAGGARGIVGYCFNDVFTWKLRRETQPENERVWNELKEIARELRSYERQLLLAESEEIPAAQLASGVMGRTFGEDGEIWRLLVNTTYETRGGLEPLGIKFERIK